MAPPVQQPTLPPEGTYTDLEQLFIAEQPKRLWPENQNSNLGALRKVLTGEQQEAVDQITEMLLELFIDTSEGYLTRWEELVGLPKSPANKTIAQRRTMVHGRMSKQVFTHARREALMREATAGSLGQSLSFFPEGLTLDAAGLNLFGDASSAADAWRIYEDVRNFSYEVWIKSSITPDLTALQRELKYLTPAGISFTIDNTKANVLDYFRTVRNKQPVGYWRMGSTADASGYGNNATAAGGISGGGGSDLALNQGSNGSTLFDGVDDHFTAPDHPTYDFSGGITAEAWIYISSIGTPGTYKYSGIMAKIGEFTIAVERDSSAGLGTIRPGWWVKSEGVWSPNLYGQFNLALNTAYHVVGTQDAAGYISLYVNGVLQGKIGPYGMIDAATSVVEIATDGVAFPEYHFNGYLDEVAIYNYALTPKQILENYKVGKNIAA